MACPRIPSRSRPSSRSESKPYEEGIYWRLCHENRSANCAAELRDPVESCEATTRPDDAARRSKAAATVPKQSMKPPAAARPSTSSPSTTSPSATGSAFGQSEYKLGPEDVIGVFVWKQPELSTTVVIRPGGLATAAGRYGSNRQDVCSIAGGDKKTVAAIRC